MKDLLAYPTFTLPYKVALDPLLRITFKNYKIETSLITGARNGKELKKINPINFKHVNRISKLLLIHKCSHSGLAHTIPHNARY